MVMKKHTIAITLYNKSTSTGMSNYCQSSLKLYLVSLFDIFLEQIRTFIDTIEVEGRDKHSYDLQRTSTSLQDPKSNLNILRADWLNTDRPT